MVGLLGIKPRLPANLAEIEGISLACYHYTIGRKWCAGPDSNRHSKVFETSRYSNSHHLRMVVKVGIEPTKVRLLRPQAVPFAINPQDEKWCPYAESNRAFLGESQTN